MNISITVVLKFLIYCTQKCKKPITLYNHSTWRHPHNMIRNGFQWFMTKKGLAASSHLESGGFARSSPEVGKFLLLQFIHYKKNRLSILTYNSTFCHLRYMKMVVYPPNVMASKFMSVRCAPNLLVVFIYKMQIPGEHHYAIQIIYPMNKILSNFAKRCVFPGKFLHKIHSMNFVVKNWHPVQSVRQMRRLVTYYTLVTVYTRYFFLFVIFFFFQIDEFVRKYAASAYHPSCTCKMGPSSDKTAVVDPETLNVHGFANLKVIFSALIKNSIIKNEL